MSHYRLNFIEALGGGPSLTPPPRRVWHGTTRDLLQARKDRCKHAYRALLTQEAGEVDEGKMDYLWHAAQDLVQSGRDLH